MSPSPEPLSPRITALRAAIDAAPPALCAERAVLLTRFLRRRASRALPAPIRKAAALAHVLEHKQVRIYDRELLVGCYTRHRVGGGLFPELHGVPVLEDLFAFDRRAVNPLTVTRRDRLALLLEVLPYWAPRFLAVRSFGPWRTARFVRDQLNPTRYLINEVGGVSHVVPDYEGLLREGTEGYRRRALARLEGVEPGSPAADFLQAVLRICEGLEIFAGGYRREALRLAAGCPDPIRRAELETIAQTCARVPRHPARTLREGLQSIYFAQIAINLESLDNSVCPGRLDQLLWPLYRADLDQGRGGDEEALELLGCFALKLCELVPVFSRRLTRFHGGLFNGQVVVVGGTDAAGRDATNPLSELLVQVMDRLRTRQPNYHARLHPGTPPAFRRQIAAALAGGAVSPALYNDAVIVPLLVSRGIDRSDARGYSTVGCVEPVAAGQSFLSTDAALLNLGLCLELALNDGRRFGRRRRLGAATGDAEGFECIEQVLGAFRAQVQRAVDRLLDDLAGVERANARLHPTPLTSMLLRGCLEQAKDATAGGARYNGSGIQGVGVIDVGDSLGALDAVVFREGAATMGAVARACRVDFHGAEALHARLARSPRYGNDEAAADRWVGAVFEVLAGCLRGRRNTRGGDYVAGFYSVTAHQAFGALVGALPSGRRAGASFSSGISPVSGADRRGPTAALRSAAALPLQMAPNGVNHNLQLLPGPGASPAVLEALIEGAFEAGCMQLQVNVLDPAVLCEARDHPERYPSLLVRVSGYSAYFGDLSPAMQQEIIDRMTGAA